MESIGDLIDVFFITILHLLKWVYNLPFYVPIFILVFIYVLFHVGLLIDKKMIGEIIEEEEVFVGEKLKGKIVYKTEDK